MKPKMLIVTNITKAGIILPGRLIPALDAEGKPRFDPNTGQPITNGQFEPCIHLEPGVPVEIEAARMAICLPLEMLKAGQISLEEAPS